MVGDVLSAEQLARMERVWARRRAWKAVVEGMSTQELMESAAADAQRWEERLADRFALQEDASYAADAASCPDFAAAIMDSYADLADALHCQEADILASRDEPAQAAWDDPVWGRWREGHMGEAEGVGWDVDDTMTMGPDDAWEDDMWGDEAEDWGESDAGDAEGGSD